MNDIIKKIEDAQLKAEAPEFRVGDTVKVYGKIKEGNRERIQVFEGVVLKRQGGGSKETFTVRKSSNGVGVEKTVPVHSPNVEKVAVSYTHLYATWPDAAIRANILAIMSFTLNRVYTEWYRNKGYDFTITSSTAYDHKWIYGRNIFDSISLVVDEIFADYLSRPNVKQPILTQYCCLLYTSRCV